VPIVTPLAHDADDSQSDSLLPFAHEHDEPSEAEGYRVDVPDHWTLMDLLRDRLELTGTKDASGTA